MFHSLKIIYITMKRQRIRAYISNITSHLFLHIFLILSTMRMHLEALANFNHDSSFPDGTRYFLSFSLIKQVTHHIGYLSMATVLLKAEDWRTYRIEIIPHHLSPFEISFFQRRLPLALYALGRTLCLGRRDIDLSTKKSNSLFLCDSYKIL